MVTMWGLHIYSVYVCIFNLDRDDEVFKIKSYRVHVLLTTPTKLTDSRKYAETLSPWPFKV